MVMPKWKRNENTKILAQMKSLTTRHKVPDDAHLTPDKSSIIHQNVQYAADSDKDVDIAPSYTRDLTRIGRPSLSVDSIRKRRNHHKEGDIQTKPKQPNP
jgi:hypothetical protein